MKARCDICGRNIVERNLAEHMSSVPHEVNARRQKLKQDGWQRLSGVQAGGTAAMLRRVLPADCVVKEAVLAYYDRFVGLQVIYGLYFRSPVPGVSIDMLLAAADAWRSRHKAMSRGAAVKAVLAMDPAAVRDLANAKEKIEIV